MVVPPAIRAEIVAHSQDEAPNEACGLLLLDGDEAVEYALQYGRDLDRNLADRFVGMYVNHWTLDYGPRGREAISRLLKEGAAAGLVPDAGEVEYITGR